MRLYTLSKQATRKAQRFQGFPKEAIVFLTALEKNNKREWFQKNKSDYENHLKAPFEAFVEDAESHYGSGKVFRIYNDQHVGESQQGRRFVKKT